MIDGVNCYSCSGTKKHENHKNHLGRDVVLGADLRTDGLLFEILGQSVGDSSIDEDDIPIVLRSWKAQFFFIYCIAY